MPGQKIIVNLDINNIGPHNGTNKISFTDEVDSNKAIFYASNGTGKSFISRTFRLTSAEKLDLNADDLLTLGQASGTLNLKIAKLRPDGQGCNPAQHKTPGPIGLGRAQCGYCRHLQKIR